MLKQKTKITQKSLDVELQQFRKKLFLKLDTQLLQSGVSHLCNVSIKILYLVLSKYLNSELMDSGELEIEIPLSEFKYITSSLCEKDYSKSLFKELTTPFYLKGRKRKKGGKAGPHLGNDGNREGGNCSWFTSIEIIDGKVKVKLNSTLLKFLLKPSSYTVLYRPEINKLKTSYALKVFQILRSVQNKSSTGPTEYDLTIKQLKNILGVPQYIRVNTNDLKVIIEEINLCTKMKVSTIVTLDPEKEIENIQFSIKNNTLMKKSLQENHNGGESSSNNGTSYFKTTTELIFEFLKLLSPTQLEGYNLLLKVGINPEIAFRHILSIINGKYFLGEENKIIQEQLNYFKENSSIQDAKTLTKWLDYSSIFSPDQNHWKKSLNQY